MTAKQTGEGVRMDEAQAVWETQTKAVRKHQRRFVWALCYLLASFVTYISEPSALVSFTFLCLYWYEIAMHQMRPPKVLNPINPEIAQMQAAMEALTEEVCKQAAMYRYLRTLALNNMLEYFVATNQLDHMYDAEKIDACVENARANGSR